MEFVNRVAELSLLEQACAGHRAELVVIYGRRRIGKTALVRALSSRVRLIYLIVNYEEREKAIEDLTLQLARQVKLPFTPRFESFSELYESLPKLSNSRIVFAVDEFQRLHGTGGVTELQAAWDSGRLGNRISLILLGSSVGMIERLGMSYEGPLYGRATRVLKLRQLPFKDSRKFVPRFSEEDRVRVYGIFGGVPAYLSLLNDRTSLRENLFRTVVGAGAPLREEPMNLISAETREPSRYVQILEAIAAGASALGEIADKSRIPQTEISKYVRVLEQELDLVQRTYPLLEVKRGKARYGLKDALTRFWFRFIRPHLPLLELGQEREVLRNVTEKIDEHVAPTFETIATEHMLHLRNVKKLAFDSLGRWWSRDTEIDLVAVDDKRTTAYFVEAKWTKTAVGADVLRGLRSKAERFPWKKENRKNIFIVYARSGFKFEPEPDVLLFSLRDLARDLEHA